MTYDEYKKLLEELLDTYYSIRLNRDSLDDNLEVTYKIAKMKISRLIELLKKF